MWTGVLLWLHVALINRFSITVFSVPPTHIMAGIGVTSLMSFKKKSENGYSMWKDREASAWLVCLENGSSKLIDLVIFISQWHWMISLSSTLFCRLTALVLKTLGQVNKYVAVDEKSLCNSVFWLKSTCQNRDGSFKEPSDYKPVKLMVMISVKSLFQ